MQLKQEHLTGYGRKLWAAHQQKGGSWSDFTNWVKGAASTVWNKAIKPAARWIKDTKSVSKVAGAVNPNAGKVASAVGLGARKGIRRGPQQGGSMAWNGYDKYAGMVNRPKLQPKPMLGAGMASVQFGN